LYQQTVQSLINATGGRAATIALGCRLVAATQHAADLKLDDQVERIGKLLTSPPLAEHFEGIGLYFCSLVQERLGRHAEACATAARAVERCPDSMKARALVMLSSAYWSLSDVSNFTALNLEASRIALTGRTTNFRAFATAQRNLATLRGIKGDNDGAIQILSNTFPLARYVGRLYPAIFLEHLNSLAVELMEAGRLAEASSAASITVASPLAKTYPNWRETAADIDKRMPETSRSIVCLTGLAGSGRREGLVEFPTSTAAPLSEPAAFALRAGKTALESTPAEVIELHRWRRRREEPGSPRGRRLTAGERAIMDNGEKLMRIVDLLSHDSVEAHQLDQAVTAVEDIVLGEETAF
jgi:hypothetical protein